MQVLLAGYNLDKEVIDELRRAAPPRLDVTPETLSASYARISRDPRPAEELRRAARAEIEKARRSNQTIIFKMGHHSVAEHAVFNFDLIGVSRLAIEEIEKFRLCSFTEKSQRYITLGGDFVLPAEIRGAGLERVFVETTTAQNSLYHELYEKLRPHVFEQNPELAQNPKKHAILDGWAKEDARYVVSLATEGQLGMTINGRNLELLIRRFASKDLAELREINRNISALAKEIAPSILLFTAASEFDLQAYEDLKAASRGIAPRKETRRDDVALVDWTKDGDDKILAALLHSAGNASFERCLRRVGRLSLREKTAIVKLAFERMEFYDFPLREFEYADMTFDIVCSASCFAQLKRHRMATLTSQDYDPELGTTLPQSIEAVGAAKEFRETIDRTNVVYGLLKKKVGRAADYVLTNAHRRRVLLKVNVREMYHISRLREDPTAQWEIRALSAAMSGLARKVMPLTCLLLGGKSSFPEVYHSVFGKSPKTPPPDFRA